MRTAAFTLLCVLSLSNEIFGLKDDPEKYFWATSHSLQRILGYFQRHHRDLNLDALIGTRILEGQLTVLQDHLHKTEKHIPTKFQNMLISLIRQAGMVSDMAKPYVMMRNITYYKIMGTTTMKDFWTLWQDSRETDPDLWQKPLYQGEAIKESISDLCISEMFGTRSASWKRCSITDECWVTMTNPGYRLYSLSHQIFYLQCGLQFGCRESIEEMIGRHDQPPLQKMITNFCSNMLIEAKIIAKNKFEYDDLFMEQAALCGIMGFRDFFTAKWLSNIISWQDVNTGCYNSQPVVDMESGVRIRHKREEHILEDRCLCHRTSVATAALANYIRYIIEYLIERS